jgi:hypothetical protein
VPAMAKAHNEPERCRHVSYAVLRNVPGNGPPWSAGVTMLAPYLGRQSQVSTTTR